MRQNCEAGIVFSGNMYYYFSKKCDYSQEIYVIEGKLEKDREGDIEQEKLLTIASL